MLGVVATLGTLGLVLSLNLESSRRALSGWLESTLNQTFHGRFEVAPMRRIEPTGIALGRVKIKDPAGRVVIEAEGVKLRFDLIATVGRYLAFYDKLSVVVPLVELQTPKVVLYPDGDSSPVSIASAFALRNPSPQSADPGRPLRLWLPQVRLLKAECTSHLAALPGIVFSAEQLEGAVLASQAGVAVDARHLDIQVSGATKAPLLARGSLSVRAPGPVHGQLDLVSGAFQATETFTLEGNRLVADGSIGEVTGAAIREYLPSWPFEGKMRMHHSIRGELPRLAIVLEAQAGSGLVRAEGRIRVAPEVEADLDVDGLDLNLESLHPDWPSSDLDFRSALELWIEHGQPMIELNGTVLPSSVQGEPVPPVDLLITRDERGIWARATLHERGLPLRLNAEGLNNTPWSWELLVNRTRLEEAPRIARLLGASGTLEGNVRGTWDGTMLTAMPHLELSHAAWNGSRIGQARLQGSVTIPASRPADTHLDLDLAGKAVTFAGSNDQGLEDFRFKASGPALEPHFRFQAKTKDALTMKGEATARTDRIAIHDLDASIEGDGTPILARARSIEWAQGQGKVEGIDLQSSGHLRGDVAFSDQELRIDMEGANIDVDRIARRLHLPGSWATGKLDINAHTTLGARPSGEFRAAIREYRRGSLEHVEATVEGKWDGLQLTGSAGASHPKLGRMSAKWVGRFPANPLQPSSWPELTGSAQATVTEARLPEWASFLGVTELGQTAGVAKLRLDLSREQKRALPRIVMDVDLTDVGIAPKALPEPLSGFRLKAVAEVGPDRTLSTALRVADGNGPLLDASGTMELPLPESTEEFPPVDTLKEALATQPFEVVAQVRERNFASLPWLSSLEGLNGTLALRGRIFGSARAPQGQLQFTVSDLVGPGGLDTPVALEGSAEVDPLRKEAFLQSAVTANGRVVANLSASGWPHGRPDATGGPLDGTLQLSLDDAPLDLLSPILGSPLDGSARGIIVAEQRGGPPRAQAEVRLADLRVDGQNVGQVDLKADLAKEFHVSGRLTDTYGSLDVKLEGPTDALLGRASNDAGAPLFAKLRADKYGAGFLRPFVSEYFSEFEGTLDGNVSAEILPQAKRDRDGGDAFQFRLRGQLHLTDGVVLPTSMGLKLEDVDMSLEIAPQGTENRVRIPRLIARARAEKHNLRGSGTLYFENLTLSRGELHLEQEAVPVLSEGVKLADVSGSADVKLKREAEELRLHVQLHRLEAMLESGSDRDLIDLREDPTITVLQTDPLLEEARVEPTGTPVVVQLDLGDRVVVKSQSASVQLRGSPELRYADGLSMKGSLRVVSGGRVQVLGRAFIVDDGTVFFDDNGITDPLLDLSATWRTQSGTLVRVRVAGRAKRPKLSWTSDPGIPGGETAIVALVLGVDSASGAATQGQDLGLAYGAAVVNELLGQTGLRGVALSASRAGGSEGQGARLSEKKWESYAASVQLAEGVWFEGKYTQESAGPDVQPRSGFSGTIDWRFHENWSARTEVGTLGMGADLLWQYRY